MSIYKQFGLGKEGRVLEFRAEVFNMLNHFNPANPNSTLSIKYATGANNKANFGTITGTQRTIWDCAGVIENNRS